MTNIYPSTTTVHLPTTAPRPIRHGVERPAQPPHGGGRGGADGRAGDTYAAEEASVDSDEALDVVHQQAHARRLHAGQREHDRRECVCVAVSGYGSVAAVDLRPRPRPRP